MTTPQRLETCLQQLAEREATIAVLQTELRLVRGRYARITGSAPWRLARLIRKLLLAVLPTGLFERLRQWLFPERSEPEAETTVETSALPATPPDGPGGPTTADLLVLSCAGRLPVGWMQAARAGQRVFHLHPQTAASGTDPAAADVDVTWPETLDPAHSSSPDAITFFDAVGVEQALWEAVVCVADPSLAALGTAFHQRYGWPVTGTPSPWSTPEAQEIAVRTLAPRASIILVTYNNLPYTRLCLDSLLQHQGYPNMEIIIVDNASSDGTPAYLEAMQNKYDAISILLNDTNRGFAAANNQGLALATGDRLVLLNNDTIVPQAWLTRLLRHLDNPQIGLAGPVTNSAGNEARISVPYTDPLGLPAFVSAHYAAHPLPEEFDIRVLAMYCVAMRRDVFEAVGPLDEIFGTGMFEDDDFAHRVRLAGYRVVCCDDVFVHHFGETSFNKLKTDGRYRALFEENRAKFEAKWKMPWVPHTYRA